MNKFLSIGFMAAGLIATSAFASQALAYPAPGDSAVYLAPNGETVSLTVKSFDGQQWTITEADSNGETSDLQWTDDQMAHQSDVATILANCAEAGGSLEDVTVPAGTFHTCKLEAQDGSKWFADVPFATVKFEVNGNMFVLKSYQSGK